MKNIEDLNILVVGDIMLDRYVEGNIERISPEAPVPIVNVTNEYYTLGGCGNVVRNLREIGANVTCLSSIAGDSYGGMITKELNLLKVNPILFFGSSVTTVKERIVEDKRKTQMLRIDREVIRPVDHKRLIQTFENLSENKYDIIIVSDYAKGLISFELMQYLRDLDVRIIVDPKPCHVSYYDNVFMITPNEKEWESMKFSSITNLMTVPYVLNTLGRNGMCLLDREVHISHDIEAEQVKVYNVSGCGDVVVAVVGACISMGIEPLKAAKIANACAGYTASLPGTSVIPKNKYTQILNKYMSED